MTRKVYKTAQGRMVDLGALQLQNEHVRAVGNMGVNARGDLVDSENRAIDSRNGQVSRQYRRQATTNTADSAVVSSRKASVKPTPPTPQPVAEIPPPPEDFDDDFVKAPGAQTSGGGLAAAIAKAREINQEPILPASKPTSVKRV